MQGFPFSAGCCVIKAQHIYQQLYEQKRAERATALESPIVPLQDVRVLPVAIMSNAKIPHRDARGRAKDAGHLHPAHSEEVSASLFCYDNTPAAWSISCCTELPIN